MTYRELLASERLDPDPTERLIATMQLGFSVITSLLSTWASGEQTDIPPDRFDPMAKSQRDGRGRPSSNVVHCGPNQMARLMSGMVELI